MQLVLPGSHHILPSAPEGKAVSLLPLSPSQTTPVFLEMESPELGEKGFWEHNPEHSKRSPGPA